jgi:hypothetical protein
MASREFLKILQSARLGDVSAQQNLASAYLTGAFKTPIQPANAWIWLEKSYLSITNHAVNDSSVGSTEFHELDTPSPEMLRMLKQISLVPLGLTFNSPAFSFGWKSFWRLAKANIAVSYAAQWQLAELLLDPSKKVLQGELAEWLLKQEGSLDLPALQKTAKEFLLQLAESNTPFTNLA